MLPGEKKGGPRLWPRKRRLASFIYLIDNENTLLSLLSDGNLLKDDPEYDTIINDLSCRLEDLKDKKYLRQHNHTIEYLEKEQRWYTRVDRPEGSYTGHQSKYRLIRGKTLEEVEKKVIDYYRERESRKTVSEVFTEWIDERIEYDEIQRSTYDRTLSCFNRFFVSSGFDKRKIDTITENDLTVFIKKSIHDHKLSTKGWQDLRGLIIGIFRYARRFNYTTLPISSFLEDLYLPKNMFRRVETHDEEQIFTDREVRMIADWIAETDERKRSLPNLGILIALTTGLRAGELSTLKWEDFEGNILHVSRTEVRYKGDDGSYVFEVREHTKGRDGKRDIAVPDVTLSMVQTLRELNPDGEYLFMHDGQRMKGDRFSNKLKRICEYLNITPRSLHKLRKTYASILMDSGSLPEKVILKQMGHTNITTTQGFYHFDRHPDNEKVHMVETAMASVADLLGKAVNS